jgi:hypothetical protein
MAGVVSGANLGAAADPRLGDEVDYIGTTDEGRGGIPDDIGAPDPHGHNTIYLDSSITFENYHYVSIHRFWENISAARGPMKVYGAN